MDDVEQKIYSAFVKSWKNTGRKTLSIIRYSVVNNDDAAGVEGDKTETSEMADLRCLVFRDRTDPSLYTQKGIVQEMRRRVIFYLYGYTPKLDDKVKIGDNLWDIAQVLGNSETTGYTSLLIRKSL